MDETLLKAPAQLGMSDIFDKHSDGMLVKQTMRGCLQECMGCEASSEYKISGIDGESIDGIQISETGLAMDNELYAIEKSSFLCRLCWRDGRPMTVKLSEGSEEGGAAVAEFRKPCGCPVQVNIWIPDNEGEGYAVPMPCCCMLPSLVGHSPDGVEINRSEYVCDKNCCVPKFRYLEQDELVYVVKPPTCCGGCCIKPNRYGRGCLKVPFWFHNPETMEPIVCENGKKAQIAKLWSGMKKECCSTADNFATVFPDGIDAGRKAGLLGLTFLADFTCFERQGMAAEA